MFDSVGWGELVVLAVAGLFILGPERLPSAAAWAGRTVRRVREYVTNARESLRTELGPEFDELRKPLEELRGLRNIHPSVALRRTLLDDEPLTPNGSSGTTTSYRPTPPSTSERLAPGERPPIDPDAT